MGGYPYLHRMGRLAEAIPYAVRAYELTAGPTKIDNAAFVLASLLIDIGDYDAAHELLAEMQATEPNLPVVTAVEVQLYMARYEVILGHAEHARQMYDRLESMPEFSAAKSGSALYQRNDLRWGALGAINLAYIEQLDGRSDKAMEFVGRAREFVETEMLSFDSIHISDSASYALCQIAALAGDNDAAIALLRRAVDDGFRQSWMARIDPLMANVSNHPEYTRILDDVDLTLAEARARLIASSP